MTTAELLVRWRRREDLYGRRRLTRDECASVAVWRQRELADAIGNPTSARQYLALWLREVAL